MQYEIFEIEQFNFQLAETAKVMQSIKELIDKIRSQHHQLKVELQRVTKVLKQSRPIEKESIDIKLDLLKDCDELSMRLTASIEKLDREVREKKHLDAM